MKERPIIFSGPMVRAILEGRKTQTRRVAKPESIVVRETAAGTVPLTKHGWLPQLDNPYGQLGDRLWVRETFATVFDCPEPPCECEEGGTMHRRVVYRSTEPNGTSGYVIWDGGEEDRVPWRPSIYMPRWASRITLEVTEVRVQRLRDISEEDALAEGVGCEYINKDGRCDMNGNGPRLNFRWLWDSINAKRAPWSSDPWVWAVSFRRVEAKERAA